MIVLCEQGKITEAATKTAGIYYWKNDTNDKGYVGQTLDFYGRVVAYKCKFGHGQPLLYRAFVKYGIANFTCYKVMDCCPSKVALNYWETYWVKELDTFGPNGYNLTSGGCCAFSVSEETREKQRNAHFKVGYCGHHYISGHKPSEETRRRLSTAHKQLCSNPSVRDRLRKQASNASNKTRARIGSTISMLWETDEYRNKQVASRTGKKLSLETRMKMAHSQMGNGNHFFGKFHSTISRNAMRKKALLRNGNLWKEFFTFN